MHEYNIGSIIQYRLSTGMKRKLLVLKKLPNVPGFEGMDHNGEGFWGHDSQIVKVIKFNACPK